MRSRWEKLRLCGQPRISCKISCHFDSAISAIRYFARVRVYYHTINSSDCQIQRRIFRSRLLDGCDHSIKILVPQLPQLRQLHWIRPAFDVHSVFSRYSHFFSAPVITKALLGRNIEQAASKWNLQCYFAWIYRNIVQWPLWPTV